MNGLHSFRWLLPILSALAGAFFTSALTSSCSSECTCAEPRPIVNGEFENVEAVVPQTAPASLLDIAVTRLVIGDLKVVVHYTRGDQPGTATYTFGAMY